MSTPFFINLSYQNKKRPPEGGLIKNKDECYLSDKSLHQSSKIEGKIWFLFHQKMHMAFLYATFYYFVTAAQYFF
jgi:hypothetical protein